MCRAQKIGGRASAWRLGDVVMMCAMVYRGLQNKGIAAASRRLLLEGDTSLLVGCRRRTGAPHPRVELRRRGAERTATIEPRCPPVRARAQVEGGLCLLVVPRRWRSGFSAGMHKMFMSISMEFHECFMGI